MVCYTNHALDQFLEEIQEFHPRGIVRVGGRSQSEAMQRCSLTKRKREMIEVTDETKTSCANLQFHHLGQDSLRSSLLLKH